MVYMTQIYMKVPSTDRCQNNQMITKDEKAIENLKQYLIFVVFLKIMVDLFLFRTILGICWRKKPTILYLQLSPHIWSIELNCCCVILTFSILPLPLAFVTSPEENWLSKSFVCVHDPSLMATTFGLQKLEWPRSSSCNSVSLTILVRHYPGRIGRQRSRHKYLHLLKELEKLKEESQAIAKYKMQA